MKKFPLYLFIFFIFSSPILAGEIEEGLIVKLNNLPPQDTITAIIFMQEQANLKDQEFSRKEKIKYLKYFSQTSQADLITYLNNEKNKGNVLGFQSFWMFNGLSVTAKESTITTISQRADVSKITENYDYKLPQTNLSAVGLYAAETNISKINADDVWSGNSITGNGVLVGVVDSGVLATHQDLSGKVVGFAQFDSTGSITTQGVANANDPHGHGTHVCGIIAGGNNGGSDIGVAPDANLIVARTFDTSGGTTTGTHTQVVAGIQWVAGEGAQIVNLSIGDQVTGAASSWLIPINNLITLGILPVIAIGNLGPADETTTSPGNLPNAFGVGSVNNSDVISSFSGRGPIDWSGTEYIKPDIVAPGGNSSPIPELIWSASNSGNDQYTGMAGTSMSTPHISGVAALLLEADSSLTVAQMKEALESTAIDLGDTGKDNTYGWGRVDALLAVNAVITPDAEAPTVTHTAVTSGTYGQAINLSATISDNRTQDPTGKVYYRPTGGSSWSSANLEQSGSTTTFSGAIPATATKRDLEYYLTGTDLTGNVGSAPANAPSSYYTITISTAETLTLSTLLNHPNPFNPLNGTTFSFYVSAPAEIEIFIFNIKGVMVKKITGSATLGYNTIYWNGITDFSEYPANGVYLYAIKAQGLSGQTTLQKGKLIVLR